MEKLRTGIIGAGKVAHLHACALGHLEQSDFRAVYNRHPGRAEKFADQYGIKPYDDVGEMVGKEKLDMVVVTTPHTAHRQPALDAFREGAHVLVEKPLASSLEDCDAMIEAAGESGKLLGTISQRRFYKPCQRIRQAIDENRIGRPVLGTVLMLGWRDRAYYESDPWRGTWKDEGGGVLVNQAPHQLDLLQWYMGEIDELYGVWENLNHPYIEVEDTALAVIRFKGGGLGNIVVSNSQKPGIYTKVHIHGETGASAGVQTDGGAMFIAGMSSIAEPPVLDIWTVPGEEDRLADWVREDSEYFNSLEDPMNHYHMEQIGDFIQAILQGRKPMVTGEDGRVAVEIFTAIYRSARDRKPVKWPLKPEKTS